MPVEGAQGIPALTQEYLRATLPYHSTAIRTAKILGAAAFCGGMLVYAAEFFPHLFPYPQGLLDRACNAVPRCTGTVERILLDGYVEHILLVRFAYAVGALLFLLGLLGTLPLLPAYCSFCSSMYRLVRMRKAHIARSRSRVHKFEKLTLDANSGLYTVLLLAASILIMLITGLHWDWEGGKFLERLINSPEWISALVLHVLLFYAALYMGLLYVVRSFACYLSRDQHQHGGMIGS